MRILGRRWQPNPVDWTPPVSVAPPSEVFHRFDVLGHAIANGAGAATITLRGPARSERWELDTLAIDSPAGTAEVWRNAEAAGNLVAVAPASPNVLDRSSPQWLAPGERLVIVFAGAGAGAVCTARMDGRRHGLG